MEEIEKVRETIETCQSQLEEIEETRSTVEAKQWEAEQNLNRLTVKLPDLLSGREFDEVSDSEVLEVKSAIVKEKETISDSPLILEGLQARKAAIVQKLEDARDLLEQYQHEAELEKLREYIPKNFFGREFELIAKPQNVNYGPGEYKITGEIDEDGAITACAMAQHVNVVPGSYEKITGLISPTGRVEINMKAEWYYGKSVGDYKVSGNILKDGSVKLFAQASREIHPPGNFTITGSVEEGVELFCEAQRSYKGPGNYRIKSIKD